MSANRESRSAVGGLTRVVVKDDGPSVLEVQVGPRTGNVGRVLEKSKRRKAVGNGNGARVASRSHPVPAVGLFEEAVQATSLAAPDKGRHLGKKKRVVDL